MKKSLLTATIVLALVLCFSFGVSAQPSSLFSDVDENAWYGQMVNEFAENGIVVGYGDGTFCPQGSITRAEFATMVMNIIDTLKTTEVPERTISFSDVNEGDWYYDAVMTLADYGIVNGYSDGTFMPNKEITREEIAYIIYKFIGPFGILTANAPEDAYIFFSDVLADRWSANAINTLTYFEAIHGYPDGTFHPENDATRAEAVAFLYNFFHQMG